MDESWDRSLMTGDQCALCESPLEGQAFELEDDVGQLLRVCASCALHHPATTTETQAHGPAGPAARLEDLKAWVEAALARREDESAGLRGLVDALERSHEDIDQWRERSAELERRLRTVEGDLARTRERLRAAEELLGWTGGEQPALKAEPAEPAAPAATPSGRSPAENAPGSVTHVRGPVPPPEPDMAVQAGMFTVDELRQVQRFFNESPFTEKTRSVRRGLGSPVVNLMRVLGPDPRVLLTVAWDIVWYQYLVRLEEDTGGEDRVTLYTEGMELDELAENLLVPNAGMDDHGRIDASELEVQLLTDQPLLTDMTAEEEAALDDATEEIWDKHTMPEFRWDD